MFGNVWPFLIECFLGFLSKLIIHMFSSTRWAVLCLLALLRKDPADPSKGGLESKGRLTRGMARSRKEKPGPQVLDGMVLVYFSFYQYSVFF